MTVDWVLDEKTSMTWMEQGLQISLNKNALTMKWGLELLGVLRIMGET